MDVEDSSKRGWRHYDDEALADVICGETPGIDLAPSRPGRFIDGEPLTSAWGEGNRG